MISIKRAPTGSMVLRSLTGGASVRVRLDIARQGPPGVAGPFDGVGGKFFTHIITPAEIASQQLLLPAVPQSEVIVSFVSGTTQRSNVDFQVTGLVMSWVGLSMELLLEAGDCIAISYF